MWEALSSNIVASRPFREGAESDLGAGSMAMPVDIVPIEEKHIDGFHRTLLTVRENNTSAVELYKKVGFEVEGLQRAAVQVDGMYENVILILSFGLCLSASLRANGSRECAPDDRLREAIHKVTKQVWIASLRSQ